MIENLVLHHIHLTLIVTGLISMTLTACAIQAGDALYRRLQREAIKRSLDRAAKLVAATLLSFCLLTSQMAFGQTPPKKQRPDSYLALFQVTDKIVALTRTTCKTEDCSKAAEELAAVIKDGQDKHARGILLAETRKQFHADFRTSMTKLRKAVVANMTEEDKAAMAKRPECPACDKPPVVRPVQEIDSERCHLCWDTLEVASEICALYLGTCNTCALICLSTAALAFGNCMERWCEPQPNPYYNNN
jgi:hypothetical protein